MFIYKITNLINGKIYIGQTTKTLQQRFNKHFQEAKSEKRGKRASSYFHNALLNYGAENFKIDLVDTATNSEELNEKEIYYINFYNSINHDIGYNLMPGGKSGKKNPQTRLKIKKKKLKNWENKELAYKMEQGRKKAIRAWQEKCKIQRINIECQACKKIFLVPPYEAKTRKYCSHSCAGSINIRKATVAAAIQKRNLTIVRNKKIQELAITWSLNNKNIIKNCPKNKISTTLLPLYDIIYYNYGIKDWRMICMAICGKPNKKDLLVFLQSFIENIC